jgi:hypothetical protein
MKTAMTSAFVFTAALAFSGAALAHTPHSGSSTASPQAESADAKKKDTKGKKGDCKHDKDHPCKGDSKPGQAK